MKKSLWYSLIGILAVAIIGLAATLISGNKPLLGLDLQGGASVVLQPQHSVPVSVLNQAIAIIQRRVDGSGVAEPSISRQGDDVVIELPGIKDPAQVLQLVGQTAQLYFRPVLCTTGTGASSSITPFPPYAAPSTTPSSTTTTTPGATTVPSATTTAPSAAVKPAGTTSSSVGLGVGGGRMAASGLSAPFVAQTPTTPAASTATTVPSTTTTTLPAYSSQDCQLATTNVGSALPSTPQASDPKDSTVLLPSADSTGYNPDLSGARYLLGPAQLTGTVVSSATAEPPDGTTSTTWFVQVNFTGSGGTAFDKLAQANYQGFVAIDLDGLVESTPQIQAQTYNGQAIINGSNFTETQSKNLALELRYGSLPVQFQAQSIQTVSATIGKNSLKAGLISGAIGLLLVLCYMLFYYRALGLVVVIGLTLSGVLLYSIVSYLSETHGLSLSLAGATGIIVSVGVTADSYIVYFERLKDEIRSGKSVRTSVDRGFRRAYRTILAADLISLMAAAILYLFSIGSVQGFAFFLGLSTLLDLITAFLFTRPMVALLGRNRIFTEARFFGVARGLAVTPAGGTQ
jgi:preprotein translocase subunit SecD